MKTNTPRTDAAQFIQHDMTAVVDADFARTLEAELAIAQSLLMDSQEAGMLLQNAQAELADEAIALRNMMSERDAAEAELATAKAIIASIEEDGTEEHNAAVRLRQELSTERARLDWLLSRMGGNVLPANGCVAWTVDVYHYKNQFPSRAAIDAAIKEETK